MKTVHGQCIVLNWEDTPDAYHVRGHVTEEEFYADVERATDITRGDFDAGVMHQKWSPVLHAYARWTVGNGWDGPSSFFEDLPVKGKGGCFPVTMIMSDAQWRSIETWRGAKLAKPPTQATNAPTDGESATYHRAVASAAAALASNAADPETRGALLAVATDAKLGCGDSCNPCQHPDPCPPPCPHMHGRCKWPGYREARPCKHCQHEDNLYLASVPQHAPTDGAQDGEG